MVEIRVVKTLEGFEFSIAKGIELIKAVKPNFNIGKITINYDTFHDSERLYGIGTLKTQIPLFFELGNLEYCFVDDSGNNI
jgi:hypothetical protein